MMRKAQPCLSLALFLALFAISGLHAQQPAGAGLVDATSSQASSVRTFSFSGTVPGQPDGSLSVTFAIYADQQSASPLWTETQVVQISSEKYNTMLGSSSAAGLPEEIFAADKAHWLGVQANGKEMRYLLVSVPYAMKAVEAERLGGLLPSDFVTTQQLQSILQTSAAQTTGTTPAPKQVTGVQNQAAAPGTPPLPATDFTDNNGSEVLLVTQQGPGYAIHAISNLQPAVYAENNNLTGTALQVVETSTDAGASTGIFAQTLGSGSIAGVFDSAGPAILELRKSGTRMVFFDQFGDITANGQVQASNFAGSGSGLTNIPNTATTATSLNTSNSIVARDFNGGFAAGTVQASAFIGSGSGLTNIPPTAINATPVNIANSVVARDGTGSFSGNQISATTFSGSGTGLTNIPPTAINATPINIANSVVARDGTGSFSGNQISATTFSGSGTGLTNIPPTAINATPVNIANSVVARDGTGSFSGNQISATTFSGSGAGLTNIPPSAVNATPVNIANSVVARDGAGSFAANIVNASGVSASATGSTAIHGDSNTVGIQASTQNGVGLWASASANDSTGTVLLLSHASLGKLISGGVGTSTNLASEAFSVDAQGDVSFTGFMMTPYETTGTWFANSLVKLTSIPGTFGAGTVTMTSAGDTAGAIGVITGLSAGNSGIQVAQGGEVFCNFDGSATAGDYVGISKTAAGECTDLGATFPANGQQVVGRVLSSFAPTATRILLFGAEQHASAGGTLTSINTGAGLTGGPITSSGTISIANNGVTNSMLQNNSITVADGPGIGGGGIAPLGGFVTISNLGALSFNGRVGDITPTLGDYSFSQILGTASTSQLPSNVVLNSQSNTFSGNQTINGSLNTAGVVATGNSTPFSSVVSVADTSSQPGGQPAFSASSSSNQAAIFLSNAPTLLTVGTLTHGVLSVNSTGVAVFGSLTATSFSGDGSALTNVSASKIGTLGPADIATATALNSETSARQSGDTTLQNNINSEAASRQSGDTTLQTNINSETTARLSDEATLSASIAAETTARQSDVSNLQTSINNVSAADAKLAASNTFTAGTQDFSGAGATLPVRALLTANTPAACVVSKELLIKTDAPAGQQLFICNATGNGWNLVGDGASGGVTTFNGRSGSVTPASGDYSFAQISGSAATIQLPATIIYNNQANTFTGNQTINGAVTATSFSGSGAALTSVNAATLNGIPSNALAQLHAINTFTSEQAFAASTAVNPSLNIPAGVAPATPLAGDVWNTGTVMQYRDNASTTRSLVSTTQAGGLQLLKLTASITPASVSSQTCSEQSFSVSGITTGDVLLSVLQPSTSSPGTNIAIGGYRVSAANTVAVQFCNVSRNNSTPVSGSYTFALMR